MLKERHRLGVAGPPPPTPRTSRISRAPHELYRTSRSSSATVAVDVRSPPEVGIIPGNRFFLLPLKKVTALLRPHTPCREPSVTSTKPCIVSKPAAAKSRLSNRAGLGSQSARSNDGTPKLQVVRQQAHSKRLLMKQRRHHRLYPAVAKTRLSPVIEQAQAEREPLLVLAAPESWLWNAGIASSSRAVVGTNSAREPARPEPARLELLQHRSWRSKDTSVFSLHERPTTQRVASGRILPPPAQDSSIGAPAGSIVSAQSEAKKKASSIYNVSDIDLLRYRSRGLTKTRFSSTTTDHVRVNHAHNHGVISDQGAASLPKVGRSFGRNNRVSPSSSWPPPLGIDHQLSILQASRPQGENSEQQGGRSCASLGDRSQHKAGREFVTPSLKRGRNHRNVGSCAAVSHQIRSSSPFLCSFTNEKDLPIGPSPLPAGRRRLPKPSTSTSASRLQA